MGQYAQKCEKLQNLCNLSYMLCVQFLTIAYTTTYFHATVFSTFPQVPLFSFEFFVTDSFIPSLKSLIFNYSKR
jgi:hypothetical protein